jgi:hypothetical protein
MGFTSLGLRVFPGRFPIAIVAARMGEGGSIGVPAAAEERAIHRRTAAEGAPPGNAQAKGPFVNELWRAAHASGEAPTDGAGCYSPIHGGSRQSLRYMDRGVNSIRVRPFFVSGIPSTIHPYRIDTMKKTVLNESHRRSGARMVDFGGWEMPLHYGSQIEEHHAVRRDAGMFDVSHMCAVDVEGADAGAFLRRLLANNVERLKIPGKALYSAMLNESRRGHRRPDRLLPRRQPFPCRDQCRHCRQGSGLDACPPRRLAACGQHHAAS